MTDLKEQAQQLIELNEKRTPGEWAERPWGDGSNFQGFSNVVCDEQELTLVTETLKEDATFIALTANHAPAIAQAYLDKCEENERLRGALRFYADNHKRPNDGPWGADSDDFGQVARQALGENNDQTG